MAESFDVIIVGAGPAGLATAYHLLQLAPTRLNRPLSVCILEKGSRVGAHLLSGALVATENTLVEQWPGLSTCPQVHQHSARWLTRHGSIALPSLKPWHHDGKRILSLSRLCQWLAQQVEQLGGIILPGLAGRQLLWEGQRLTGVVTAAKADESDAIALTAPVTVLAEGCRGFLSQQMIERMGLDQGRCPQTYGLALREVWQVRNSRPGHVLHTLGWPCASNVYGGGFLYHLDPHHLALGLVVGLDYRDPQLSPFNLLQRWKGHPLIQAEIENGQLLGYGARTVVSGGWHSLPQLVIDGGLLVGDAAGLFDVPRLQGVAHALQSGRLAAETILDGRLPSYHQTILTSAIGRSLWRHRNIRTGFRSHSAVGLINAAWEGLTGGCSPWHWRWHQSDRQRLQRPQPHQPQPIDRPSGLDRSSALAYSGLRYNAQQPCHLHVSDQRRHCHDD
ncbi:MAG: NAD(P)/FAD-dependent oxidoreductase, partial [Magnetococcales bacterium]|nr:NAD(P)/FAD-dependent oxidoreductase [Magnetococcales bacterium]